MTSAFFGLNTAASALRTAQTLVDITNQNIANANTPGYSRQSATVTATQPYPTPVISSMGTPGQLGTGVQITQVNRARNLFADYQVHGQLSLQGQVDAKRDALGQVEATVNEPSATGLGATVTKYWAAWQEVANTPSDSAVRTNLVEAGNAVADVFQSTVTQFKQQQTDLGAQVSLGIASVNTYAGQIAGLNSQIVQVEASGMKANDLRDQRDLVVDQLSSLVKITTSESANGALNINVGNHQLVDRDSVHAMQVNTSGASNQPQWGPGTAAVSTASGALGSPGVTTGGSMVINGIPVAVASGDTSATVMGSINTAMGPNGPVTASLNPLTGALVLTSTIKGSSGAITLGATSPASNTIYGDLGLTTPAVVAGTDDAVNLGGGKLQGLMDSNGLLQERIDDVNTLASRLITSVNAVQVSGVGLDGKGGINFFSGTNATDMAVDSNLTGAGGTDHIAAARMTVDPVTGAYSSAAGDSSNAVALAQIQNAISQPATGGTGLAPAQPVGVSGAKLIGLDLSGAAANTKYSFGMQGSPAALSVAALNPDGTTTYSKATITAGSDAAGNQILTVDSGAVRLTLSYTPSATSVPPKPVLTNAALVGLVTTDLVGTPGSPGIPGLSVNTQATASTLGDQYAQQIASLGVESQTAQSQSANQQILVDNLNTQRQQVSGVSLDEETVNLMMYQKAYQAAARVISTMDGMLDTLINHTIL